MLALVSAALGDEAPATAALIEAASGVTSGKADEAIGAAVDMIKELRQRRQERKAKSAASKEDGSREPGSIQPIDEKSQDPSKQEAPKRPLRDALKNILGGNASSGG